MVFRSITDKQLTYETRNGVDGWTFNYIQVPPEGDYTIKILARCQTEGCRSAKTPDKITGAEWEVSKDGKTFSPVEGVTTACCPADPVPCMKCSKTKECEGKSFSQCVLASTFGCCTMAAWVDSGACKCNNVRPACKKSVAATNSGTKSFFTKVRNFFFRL